MSTSPDSVLWEAELTDTFGGEANYYWVKRQRFTLPAKASNRVVIREAKRALGLTGRHKVSSYGETIVLLLPADLLVILTPVEPSIA